MIIIDKQGRTPIYEQLIDAIKKEILNGIWTAEDEFLIPSVRTLSIELSINPNTIQKAYNELERVGITTSAPGVGRYVSKDAVKLIKEDMQNAEHDLKKCVMDLKTAGCTLKFIMDKVKTYYDEGSPESKQDSSSKLPDKTTGAGSSKSGAKKRSEEIRND